MLKRVISFFKLLRPANLIIIVATMFVVRYFLLSPLLESNGRELTLPLFDFALLTLIMVLMAGSGNIINDYFDVRVDRINKPEKVIIDKGVKRRVAMGAHQLINILAILIVLFLSYRHFTWWPVAIPIAIISGLWFYSSSLQKMFLIGNITIAIIVSTVPLWVGVFELQLLAPKDWYYWQTLGLVAVFVFLITLVRELVKDLQDAKGDSDQGYKTLAIVWGTTRTKRFAAGWAVLLMVLAIYVGFRQFGPAFTHTFWIAAAYILLVIAPVFLLIIQVVRAQNPTDFGRASTVAKYCMALGIVYLPLWGYWCTSL